MSMEGGTGQASTLLRPSVLIVDDDARNLDVLEAMLEPLECAFVRAQSADEALLCLLRHDLAAIVLDVRMPETSGLELATLIKQRKRSQHVPILFLTAHAFDESDVLRGYGVGAVDFLSKPINAEIFRSKIGVFVDLYRTSRALAEVNEALQREIGERESAQEALRRANQELEERVAERTVELTRMHRSVSENELRLRLGIEVASMGAWEWHLESGRMTWSTDPEALFEFPSGSFGDDLRLSRLVHPEDKVEVEHALAAALDSGVYEVEYRTLRPDGSIVWLADRGRIVADPEGRRDRMVGITRNITRERQAGGERERLLTDAQAARDEAEAANRAKDEFFAMLSHELRNPLNVIALGMSVLGGAGVSAEQVDRTRQMVARQVRHLARLIDDLLDVARVASGRVVLTRRPLDLAATVSSYLSTVGHSGGVARHQWSQRLQATWINGDETRIEQIVSNLLANAAKFTPEGGRIEVEVGTEDGDAVFRVTDSGVGIEPQLLPRIFDLFTQGDQGRREHGEKGLGIGLALVRRLTELHGGTVVATSEGPGRGASFTVRLPSVSPASSDAVDHASVPRQTRRRILVVEDNADGRDLLRAVLEGQGHDIHAAADGEAAIRVAENVRPDVAIVDIGLPGIDGYVVAGRLRAMGGIRLIALTGYGANADRRRAMEAGFDMHLTKPVDPQQLAALLRGNPR